MWPQELDARVKEKGGSAWEFGEPSRGEKNQEGTWGRSIRCLTLEDYFRIPYGKEEGKETAELVEKDSLNEQKSRT